MANLPPLAHQAQLGDLPDYVMFLIFKQLSLEDR